MLNLFWNSNLIDIIDLEKCLTVFSWTAPPKEIPKSITSYEGTPKLSFQQKQYTQIEQVQQNTINGKLYIYFQ